MNNPITYNVRCYEMDGSHVLSSLFMHNTNLTKDTLLRYYGVANLNSVELTLNLCSNHCYQFSLVRVESSDLTFNQEV